MTDGTGIAFAEYPAMLPKLCRHWPAAEIVRSVEAYQYYKGRFDICQICGREFWQHRLVWQIHHIIGGAGRSDEPTNFLKLCLECHDESWSVILPECLYAKWLTDRENLSWVRLAVLLGHHLPEPKERSK